MAIFSPQMANSRAKIMGKTEKDVKIMGKYGKLLET